jgi:hypothetical protein
LASAPKLSWHLPERYSSGAGVGGPRSADTSRLHHRLFKVGTDDPGGSGAVPAFFVAEGVALHVAVNALGWWA